MAILLQDTLYCIPTNMSGVHSSVHHINPAFKRGNLKQWDIGSHDTIKVYLRVGPLGVAARGQEMELFNDFDTCLPRGLLVSDLNSSKHWSTPDTRSALMVSRVSTSIHCRHNQRMERLGLLTFLFWSFEIWRIKIGNWKLYQCQIQNI